MGTGLLHQVWLCLMVLSLWGAVRENCKGWQNHLEILVSTDKESPTPMNLILAIVFKIWGRCKADELSSPDCDSMLLICRGCFTGSTWRFVRSRQHRATHRTHVCRQDERSVAENSCAWGIVCLTFLPSWWALWAGDAISIALLMVLNYCCSQS